LQNQADLDKQIAENQAKENSILLLEKDKDLKAASLRKKEAETAAQKSKLKLLDEQKRITESENRNQRYIIYSFIGGLVLLVILLFNMYRGYQQKKKANLEISRQKAELQLQKDIVDEKNKEILDSINYAKRLQEAILPSPKTVSEYLKQFFILYKPKDIVAGDFYWLEAIQDAKDPANRIILFAAADCTGHGVPGALVSVVCSNALNRAVKEFNITDTGKILDKVRELVIETFEKSDKDVKDGMDISLCSLNLKTNELLWSGANNPLWILKKGAREITEIKPDKQPIGRYMAPHPFKTHSVRLEKDDAIYLFTDGYADQFGGPKGKKFKYSNLGNFISEIGTLNMDKQQEQLQRTFEQWQGDLEQVDDVCIIGIRL
jgi:serine phosphatase RsbU (regulator of sigma subunit)